MLQSKVENSNSAYVKLYVYSINIPGFKRQIDPEPSQQSQAQTNSRWSRSKYKFEYPTHDELGFLESKYMLQ